MRNKILLFLIVIIALFLRLYKVTAIPPSLSWDEVSIGYNAYSILKTGRDEHGRFLPLDAFVAYGDYKPPIPVYLTVPFVAVFGLNELAVRLPSVLAGTLTVLLLYFLVNTLFLNPKLSVLSSLLLAISPWHIQLSRAGFEANIALFFIVLGVWLVLKTKDNAKWLVWCWLPFVAAVYTFNSARYAGPLIAFALLLFIRRTIIKYKKTFFTGLIISVIALLPILPHLLSREARLRFEEVSIFNDLGIVLKSNERRQLDNFSWWSNIFHNRRVGFIRSYLIHFFDNLEPRFLFIHGDGNPKFSLRDVGELYLIEFPFLLYGLFSLFAADKRIGFLLLFWIIASIAPAAVARETPHALRIENAVPAFYIFITFGMIRILPRLKLTFLLIYLFLFSYFWHNYFNHYAKEFSGEWQYGYREAVQFAESVKEKYDRIVLTESIGRPYMYVLFYTAYDPVNYWQSRDGSFDAAGFYNVFGFDKYRFTREGISQFSGRTLYILSPQDAPKEANILKTVKTLNGSPVLTAFEL